MTTSVLIILLVILVLLLSGILGIVLFRQRVTRHKKEHIPNFEIIRRTLMKQLQNLGARKPAMVMFSARFALEGFREGNPRKIHASGLRELQYLILETIRERGARLKIRTAAFLFISYIDRVLAALTEEQSRLEKKLSTLDQLQHSWYERRSGIDQLVETCRGRIVNFFSDRIPNAQSFAERESVAATPDSKISKDFASIVARQSEIRTLARQLSAHIDEALTAYCESFKESTGTTIVVPIQRSRFEEGALERMRAIAVERGRPDDDAVPAVVSGLLEVRQRLHDAFVRTADENIRQVHDGVQKYIKEASATITSRMKRINAALDTFRQLRNDFNAHE